MQEEVSRILIRVTLIPANDDEACAYGVIVPYSRDIKRFSLPSPALHYAYGYANAFRGTKIDCTIRADLSIIHESSFSFQSKSKSYKDGQREARTDIERLTTIGYI